MLDSFYDFAFGRDSHTRPAASKASVDGESVPSLGLGGAPAKRLGAQDAKRYGQAYGGTDAIDWFADCVDLYAQTTSSASYHFEKDGKKYSPQQEELSHPETGDAPDDLVSLFQRPNPFMDWTEHIELAVIDFIAAGEFLWLKYKADDIGRPLALYRLAPSLVDIELGREGIPTAYVYTAPGGKPVRFKPDEVVHGKRPNPHSPWRGLSMIAASPRMYDIELALTESVAQYYEQGTRLSGVLESDRSVPPSSWTKLKRQFANLYSGQRNAYKVAMLERGLKFKSISGSAAEAQFEAITNLSKERIMKALRVPAPLLGEMAGADRQAVREAQRIFDNKTMRPFLNRMQATISHQLTQAWGFDFCFDYEYVMPIEDRLDLAVALSALPGIQVQDVRRQVGLPALQEQDAKLKKIDEMILNLPGEDRNKGGFPDRRDPAGGRPPNPENTREIPNTGSLPAGAAAIDARRGDNGKA